jgi:hypothetical protein
MGMRRVYEVKGRFSATMICAPSREESVETRCFLPILGPKRAIF